MSKSQAIQYLYGFGGYHQTEAIQGSLPKDQNSPQNCPGNLYAEQLSGSAFTAPRHQNLRSWLYRMRPSVVHKPFKPMSSLPNYSQDSEITPNQLRWSPLEIPAEKTDFVQGLFSVCGAGSPAMRNGVNIYIYSTNTHMTNKAMYNSDGDFLFVPQQGSVMIQTELGRLLVSPKEIAVVPRAVKFRVDPVESSARGYILEVFNGHFELPDLGPIGANGLAEPRHFLYPTAFFQDESEEYVIVNKYMGKMFSCVQDHSPFDVVAWHGNYGPFKYDLSKFNTINTVSFDHPDPSIYTVLTVKSAVPGTALADFVIFPPRWMVAENTFRPPYFHRNCMAEFMGLIDGSYDAKAQGFVPGGFSLHSIGTPHGPDFETFQKAIKEPMAPQKFNGGLAFMFETSLMLSVSKNALESKALQGEYYKAWQGFVKSDLQ